MSGSAEYDGMFATAEKLKQMSAALRNNLDSRSIVQIYKIGSDKHHSNENRSYRKENP